MHRDIKPDNIMFDEFGQCVLTDFGIAKAASGQKLTGTGMSIGTPHYMSPGAGRAQAIDGRSDIYSLGIVAYQCLTGTVPYDGEDSFSIGYKHITEPIPTPRLITADERRIFEVIKRMLMKDPADRFQSCEELVASIQGQPTAAPGAMRLSAAAASVSSGGGSATAPSSDAVAISPMIVSQPTTTHSIRRSSIVAPFPRGAGRFPARRRSLPRDARQRLVVVDGSGFFSRSWVVGAGLLLLPVARFSARKGPRLGSAAAHASPRGAKDSLLAPLPPLPSSGARSLRPRLHRRRPHQPCRLRTPAGAPPRPTRPVHQHRSLAIAAAFE